MQQQKQQKTRGKKEKSNKVLQTKQHQERCGQDNKNKQTKHYGTKKPKKETNKQHKQKQPKQTKKNRQETHNAYTKKNHLAFSSLLHVLVFPHSASFRVVVFVLSLA